MAQDALPIDSGTSGFNSPQASVALGKGGTGAAFILGDSKAAEAYRQDAKEVLRDAARQKAALNKQLADASDVPTKGAWDVDLPELQMEKNKIRDNASKIMMKAAGNRSYMNSKQYYEDQNDLRHQQEDLLMRVQASAQQKAHYNKEMQSGISAPAGKYKSSTEAFSGYKGKGGIKDIDRRMALGEPALLEQLPKYDFYKTAVPEFQKSVGTNYKEDIKGLIKTGNMNPLDDPNFNQKVERDISTYLESPAGDEAIKYWAVDNNTGLQRMTIDQAKQKVHDVFKDSIKEEVKKSEYHPPVGETKKKEMVGDLQEGVPIKFASTEGGDTINAKAKVQARIEKPVTISNTTRVFDSETGTQMKGLPTNFSFNPSDVIITEVKKANGSIIDEKRILGTVSYYEPADTNKIRADLLKRNQDLQTKEWIENNPNKTPTKTDMVEILKKSEPSKDEIDQEAERQGKQIKTKDVAVPYEENKNIYGENAKTIDKKLSEYEKKNLQGNKPIKLGKTVDPNILKKGQEYELNGKVYTWDGTKLKLK